MLLSLSYIIKSGSILLIMYAYYHFLLKRNTFFKLNRFYLIATLIFALVTPLISINLSDTPAIQTSIVFDTQWMDEVYVQSDIVPEAPTEESTPVNYWLLAYLCGCLFFGCRYLLALFQLSHIIHTSPHKYIRRIHFIKPRKTYPTFSFFNYLFINIPSGRVEDRRRIFEHEKIHIRQLHSVDLILAEIICILNWYNPLVWIIKNLIAQNHEYLADNQVVRKFQTGSYLELLMHQTLKGHFSFINCFSPSNLKKRMIMMTKKQSRKYKIISYIPAIAIAMTLFFSYTGYSEMISPEQIPSIWQNEIPTIPAKSETPVVNRQAVDSTSNSSSKRSTSKVKQGFTPGNIQKWLNSRVVYPYRAMMKGIEGKVYIQMVVEKDGSVNDVKVIRGVDSLLDNEAVRVIKEMPRWNPIKKQGEPVRAIYTIPVNFKINDPDRVYSYEMHLRNYAQLDELVKQKDYELIPNRYMVEKLTKTLETDEKAYEKLQVAHARRFETAEAKTKEKLSNIDLTEEEKNVVLSAMLKEAEEGMKLMKELKQENFIEEYCRINFIVLAVNREKTIQKALGENYRTFVEGFYVKKNIPKS